MKSDLISFKVEPSLAEAIERLPNRSEFIRKAVLAALRSTCPLCQGIGVLTPEQRSHWDRFTRRHTVERCEDCNAVHLHCGCGAQECAGEGGRPHREAP
jgi:hypothetical protein